MKTREQKVQEFLKTPIEPGQFVNVRGLNHNRPNDFCTYKKVLEVKEGGVVVVDKYATGRSLLEVAPEDYKRCIKHIGANPFPDKPWNAKLRIVAFNLYSILHSLGWENDREDVEFTTKGGKKVKVPRANWNPIFVDGDGNEVGYQRDFCWTLKDKQLLIDSIYNNIDIGKIVVRKRDFDYAVERAGEGKEVGFADIVDGKQRLNAIFSFIGGEFKDSHGNYWDDLSERAQSKFLEFQSIAYGEIGEEASDEDVKAVFLGVNFAGVPMSAEHVDFVKSIQL